MKRTFRPQLAKGGGLRDVDAYLDKPMYCQEKFDGVRLIIHKDKAGRLSIYGRNLSKVTGKPVRYTAHLPYNFSYYVKRAIPDGTVLDVELVTHKSSSSFKVMEALSCKPLHRARRILARASSGYHFKVFDVLAWQGLVLAGTTISYERRLGILKTIQKSVIDAGGSSMFMLQFPPSVLLETREEKLAFYQEILDRQGEGMMLKDPNAGYQENKRISGMLKVKGKITWDVFIIGITPAKPMSIKKGHTTPTPTRIAGQVGDIQYGMYKVHPDGTKEEIRLGRVSGFSDEIRKDLNANWETYAKDRRVLEIEGQQMLLSGAIRHATFLGWRDDKSADDCIFVPPLAPTE